MKLLAFTSILVLSLFSCSKPSDPTETIDSTTVISPSKELRKGLILSVDTREWLHTTVYFRYDSATSQLIGGEGFNNNFKCYYANDTISHIIVTFPDKQKHSVIYQYNANKRAIKVIYKQGVLGQDDNSAYFTDPSDGNYLG